MSTTVQEAPPETYVATPKSAAGAPRARPAPARVWKESIATGSFSTLGKMRHIRGDHDVYTKSGRQTHVKLNVRRMRIADDGKSWVVDVFYQVAEARKDYTTFQFEGAVSVAIPQDAVPGSSFVTNARAYEHSWAVSGQCHDVMEVPYTENTILTEGSVYRIDGRGDDDGAVFAELHFAIPFRYLDKVG